MSKQPVKSQNRLCGEEMSKQPVKCPKCGCMVYDPFWGVVVIHDIEKCSGPARVKQ